VHDMRDGRSGRLGAPVASGIGDSSDSAGNVRVRRGENLEYYEGELSA
jgi:hypothetical protein